MLLFAAFALLTLALYRPALTGEFVSDDIGYFQSNPYTGALTAENVAAIVDPRGPAKYHTANYAPVHLLAHALEWHIFAEDVVGYHVVNVLVHAAGSALLVLLLLSSGVPAAGALLGGVIFAVHPANVEAVAWISQLKTSGALALSLGALLAQRRHGALAALLFALALLTKASAAFALPMAAAFTWARSRGPGASRAQWAWLGVWAVILGLYAIPQIASFAHIGAVRVPAYQDPWVHARTIAAVGLRYLAMAATSYGVSAFQEPSPALSALDPWWLAALPAGGLLAWRTLATLGRRSEEAAYWVGAAAAFAPVSQFFPFLHPTADRYLYFLLPGLIGGGLLWATGALRSRARPAPVPLVAVGLIACVTVAAIFAWSTAGRARLWRNETLLLVDAADHYPEGGIAHFLRARRAAQAGDVEAAVASIRAASERGFDRFMPLLTDPAMAPIRRTPAFLEAVRDIAGRWLEVARERGYATQAELRVMGHAHWVRGEYAEAAEQLERAIRAGGPLEAVVRQELEAVRSIQASLANSARSTGSEQGDGDRPQEP